jgi:hypothetical protein
MAKEKDHTEQDDSEEIEETIDPYTGELKPVPEDADKFIEVVPEETDDRRGENYLLNEESGMDSYVADADDETAAEISGHYTDDEDIKEDFAERQNLAVGGREELEEELEEHHSVSPDLSGGDLDASWQTANVAGEETVGGTAPTPDQDIVDNLGAAAGLTYEDDEPLNSDKKVLDRDRHRWELDPASANDEEDEDLESLEDLEDEELDELEDDVDDLEEEQDEDELDEDDEDEEDDEDSLDDEIIDGELEDEDDEEY